MFVVKKLSKNGSWNAISLIDENGSFRGEARFESQIEAQKYLQEYRNRMTIPQELKIFSDNVSSPVARRREHRTDENEPSK